MPQINRWNSIKENHHNNTKCGPGSQVLPTIWDRKHKDYEELNKNGASQIKCQISFENTGLIKKSSVLMFLIPC